MWLEILFQNQISHESIERSFWKRPISTGMECVEESIWGPNGGGGACITYVKGMSSQI